MHQTRSVLTFSLALMAFQKIICGQQEICPVLDFLQFKDYAVGISENDYINLTFWLNTSECKQPNTVYKMTVNIKTHAGLVEEDGRLTVVKGTCSVASVESLRCLSPVGPAQLYRRVNRSHVEIELKWRWKEKDIFTEQNMTVKLNISYPPSVTNLTVDGHEVKNTYLIDEGQEANILCSFDKGNPPATFFRLSGTGFELTVPSSKRQLGYLLPAAECKYPWLVIRCEGQGSKENRSVTLLVKCPPLFTDVSPKVIDPEADGHMTFAVTGHTTKVDRCLLTSTTPKDNSSREVICRLNGDPPNLFLTAHLQEWIEGSWTLTVSNKIGIGKTTIMFGKMSGGRSQAVLIGVIGTQFAEIMRMFMFSMFRVLQFILSAMQSMTVLPSPSLLPPRILFQMGHK